MANLANAGNEIVFCEMRCRRAGKIQLLSNQNRFRNCWPCFVEVRFLDFANRETPLFENCARLSRRKAIHSIHFLVFPRSRSRRSNWPSTPVRVVCFSGASECLAKVGLCLLCSVDALSIAGERKAGKDVRAQNGEELLNMRSVAST